MREAVAAFDRYAAEYDRWFDENPEVFAAQRALLRGIMPACGRRLEVGVGSGRFASALGIGYGIDPSRPLVVMARQREVEVVLGCGESLPYRSGTFDCVLMMTVICFVEDLRQVFREAFRVIRPSGTLVIGFLEKDGEVAVREADRRPRGRFLRHAAFRSADDVTTALAAAGFSEGTVVSARYGLCMVRAGKK